MRCEDQKGELLHVLEEEEEDDHLNANQDTQVLGVRCTHTSLVAMSLSLSPSL